MVIGTDSIEFVFGENASGFSLLFRVLLPFYVAVTMYVMISDWCTRLERVRILVGNAYPCQPFTSSSKSTSS